MAAGTVTTTEERLQNVHKVTFAWTSGTAGEAGTATATTTYPYTGILQRVVTVPGLAPNVPTDNYDITLTDEAGVDIANGLLLNRDDTLAEWVTSGMGAIVQDKLTFTLIDAGAAKTGTCYAYIGLTAEAADISATLTAQTAGGRQVARRTYSFAVDGGAAGTFTMFTVTGTVLAEVFGVCQTSLTADGAATIEVGISGNTAALIAQTLATDLDQYETWQDATPEPNPGAVDPSARSFVITNGADIGFKVTTANLTAGIVDFYCLWTPLSAGASVVAA